jgi:Zn-dependent oligopeptidase
MLEKLEKLKTFMSGTFVARQNEFTFLDMYLYLDEAPETVEELDKKALELINTYGIWKRDENCKMYASFGHIF